MKTSASLLIVTCVVLELSACSNEQSTMTSTSATTLTSSVAAGDLNGDGRPDLTSTNISIVGPPPHSGQVSVILQSQSSPGVFGGSIEFGVGSDPQKVAIGDLNGDGFEDLVTANNTAASISILFQNSVSPGTFLTAKNLGVGAHPTGIAIGDLNGDGHLDIAVADSGLSILFQNPNAEGIFLSPMSLGVNCSSVAIGDFNADGRLDLVATSPNAGNVSILLQSTIGSGNFLFPLTVLAGFQPIDVAVADLNNDGLPDLAIANSGTPDNPATASLSVLLNNLISPGRFLAATNHATGARSQSVAVGDLNGDRNVDVAVANAGGLGNAGSVSILFQNPGGWEPFFLQ